MKIVMKGFCLLLFFLLAGSLPAQEQETVTEDDEKVTYVVVEIPRKLVVFLQLEGGFAPSEKLLLAESLLIKLAEDEDIIVQEPLVTGPVNREELGELTAGQGGDCWLYLRLSLAEQQISVEVVSYDLHQERLVFEEQSVLRSRDLRGISRRFWQDVLDRVEEGYEQIVERKRYVETLHIIPIEDVTVIEKGVEVTFVAAPGTRIQGAGDQPLQIGETGRITVELLRSSTYDLRASCLGYYPVKKQVFVENISKTVTFQQVPASRWGAELYLQYIDYLGVGASFHVIPNYLFLELRGTFFQKKLIWPVDENRENFDLALTPVFLSVGGYLNPEDSFIRFALSTGVFIRLVGLKDVGITIDPLSSWGLRLLSVTAEFLTHPKIKPYMEYSGLLYFTKDGNLMKAAILGVDSSDNMLDGYIFTDRTVLDLLNFKVGVRMQFP